MGADFNIETVGNYSDVSIAPMSDFPHIFPRGLFVNVAILLFDHVRIFIKKFIDF